ncbi:MAG: hypothetical protein EBU46_00145 [Nitrosomonadaceae bacterium]|nr:hypothetical protein [Nitrosomonadaceae bacterium]
MNAVAQHYVQANFALAGWVTVAHIPDDVVATKTPDEIFDATLSVPWIQELRNDELDYGDMLDVRLIQESIIVHKTRQLQ